MIGLKKGDNLIILWL